MEIVAIFVAYLMKQDDIDNIDHEKSFTLKVHLQCLGQGRPS